jgi:hypothetical protein
LFLLASSRQRFQGNSEMRFVMRENFRRKATALRIGATLLLAAGAATAIYAEHTRYWREASYEEFEKGTSKGVAIRSDGKLVLAPKFAPLADPGLAYLWALRTDSKGNLYAAGGSSAKVLRYDSTGKVTTAFESNDLSAQAIAVDSHDNLFVATSPDGKVYVVTAAGEKKVFFEPKTKYIWDIAIDSDGTAYVATGDTGTIFAVTPDGKSSVFYKSDQANIRSLAFDHSGNLIAGTEPDGRILRIPKTAAQGKSREGFVLYETPNEEVTSLLVDRAGNIYAASIGEKTHGGAAPFISAPVPSIPQAQPSTSSSSGGLAVTFEGQAPQAQTAPPQSNSFNPIQPASGSSVFRIEPDGSPQQLWSSRDVLVYSLGMDPAGNVLLGTGNSGEVLLLDGNHLFTKLEKTETAQVTGITQQTGGKVFVCTANPAKVFALGPDDNAEGTFDSEPFDARFFTHWGRLEWQADMPAEPPHAGPRVEFFIRAGNTANPDENWSTWAGPYDASGQRVEIPAARYAQWRAVLHSGSGSPILDWISLSYLPKNVAPEIQAIEMQDPGIRVQTIGAGLALGDHSQAPVHLRLPQLAGAHMNSAFSSANVDSNAAHFDAPPQATMQKGYQSVLWLARDENDDDLVYTIYYRAENETQWKLLKDDIHDKFYSWDTSSMPDGAYYLKIVASDSPSNPPDQALETSMTGDRFIVDNTAPAITGPQAEGTADGAHVRFTAKDPGSNIARAEYSVDAGDWKLVEPIGRLSDSATENYDFALHRLNAGEHTVAVRVYDRFENISVGKVVFHVGPQGQ